MHDWDSRKRAIQQAHAAGKTLQQVADVYGVSRERIRQVALAWGIVWSKGRPPTPRIAAMEAKRQQRAADKALAESRPCVKRSRCSAIAGKPVWKDKSEFSPGYDRSIGLKSICKQCNSEVTTDYYWKVDAPKRQRSTASYESRRKYGSRKYYQD